MGRSWGELAVSSLQSLQLAIVYPPPDLILLLLLEDAELRGAQSRCLGEGRELAKYVLHTFPTEVLLILRLQCIPQVDVLIESACSIQTPSFRARTHCVQLFTGESLLQI